MEPATNEHNLKARIDQTAGAMGAPTQDTIRRIRRIQAVTIVWMFIEAGLSVTAAWRARSPALLAFGGDSVVELLSAVVVLWRFRSSLEHERAEQLAARAAGGLLFLLAAYVAVVSAMTLMGANEPRPSYLGIGVLAFASVIMPWLARTKRRLSASTRSATLRADAAQSGLCGYLSLIALAGLVLNAIWRVTWADPAAALAILPLILREAKESIRGNPCNCHTP